jgi:sarcosine oxidase subunit beta
MSRSSPAILIIGAGAIGCAIALELGRRGVRDVLVLERGAAGQGSSSRAAGGFRALFPTEIGVRCSLLSRPWFQQAEELLGGPIGYRENGYLMLARGAEQAVAFRSNVVMQRSLGVDVHLLTPDDLEAGWPWLRPDEVGAAIWCPADAIFDQVAFMQLLAQGVRGLGIEIREGVSVRRLLVESERVIGIETDAGVIHAGTTVLAAGVWSGPLAATAGLDLPIIPIRGEIFTTGPVRGLPLDLPFVTDFDRGRYLRPAGDGFRISGELAPAETLEVDFDPARGPASTAWAGELVPALAGVPVTGGWAGLVEITPDFHPLLGRVPGLDGLIVAAGFCGYGVMHAPAAGMLTAELLLDGRATTLDIAPLAPTRFAEGRAIAMTTAPLQPSGDTIGP